MSEFIFQIEKEELDTYQELTFYTSSSTTTNITTKRYPYAIYVQKEHFESLNIESDNIVLSNKEYFNKNKEKIVKVEISNKELYGYIIKNFREIGYPTYEEDVSCEHRALIEDELPVVKGDLKDIKLKTLSIDIETIGEVNSQEIVLISTYSNRYASENKVYINEEKLPKKQKEDVKNKKFEGFEPIFCKNEKELLKTIKKDIISFEPQIILGWNVIDFDFKVIKERMKYYNIEFTFSPHKGITKMRVAKDFFGKSSLTFPGCIVFDCIQLLKTNFITFDDFKLNTVASQVLGDEKIDLDDEGDADLGISNKIDAITHMLNNDPIKLIEYNFKDSLLTQKIADKLELVELMIQRSIITNTPLLKVQSPIASLDIMYLTQLKKQGFVANSHFNFTDSSQIEGAYVITPKPNFYKDVFVLDFKSLYPSIIMTFNLDPFTYTQNGPIVAPNEATFSRNPGILPQLIKNIFEEREKAKKENNHTKAFALKITMNSFYGAIASPKSRFYNKEIGEAITSFGRHIIQKAKAHVEEESLGNVIYGDTDSIFVESTEKFTSFNKKKEYGKNIEENLNKYFSKWCKEKYNVESKLVIELEKLFSKFFIASKKRYVGYDEFSKKISFTGMEAVRGDWTTLAKDFQKKLISIIFDEGTKEDIKTFILEEIENLKKGKFDEDITYKKKLSKPLNKYTKTTPPHVKAARELHDFKGKIVEYIMTLKGPKHISKVTPQDTIDYQHYIDKQLKGVSDDILEAFGLNFDEIVENNKQKSLSSFF